MAREKICGIYAIINTYNNKTYIGQSIDIYKRWTGHRRELRNQEHGNIYLQRAWNKYGESAFQFKIIEKCVPEMLNSLEISYIEQFDSFNNGYNLTLGGDGNLGWIPPESVRLARTKPIILLNTLETFSSITEANKKTNISTTGGIAACCSHQLCFSGQYHGQNAVWMYLSEYNLNPLSQKEIDEIVFLAQGNAGRQVILLNTLQRFPSLEYAAKTMNISKSNIIACCRGKQKTAGESDTGERYIWMYYDEYLESTSELINQRMINSKIHNGYEMRKKTIVLLNTKEIFNSIDEAASKYKISASNISACCSNKSKSAGFSDELNERLVWMTYNDYCKLSVDDVKQLVINAQFLNIPPRQPKKVICLNTHCVYDSMSQAQKEVGIHSSLISRSCSKNHHKKINEIILDNQIQWMYYNDYIYDLKNN